MTEATPLRIVNFGVLPNRPYLVHSDELLPGPYLCDFRPGCHRGHCYKGKCW